MRYEVLGPVRAWRDGAVLNLGPSQRRVILAVLLLHANRPMSREQLIDAVWGEAVPKYAANLLQKNISALRRQLEPSRPGRTPSELLVWTDAGYLLTVPAGDLDLQTFDRDVACAREARAKGDRHKAAETLHQALKLWQGQPFDGLTSPLLDAQRDRLLEQRIGLVEDRIELDLALGADLDLVSELRQLVSDHPLRDRLSASLMLALYRGGQRAEALSLFHDVRRQLRDELGIDPPASLQVLHQQILAGDSYLDLPQTQPTSAAPAADRKRTTPRQSRIDLTVAHPGRMYDYWLGGRHNFAADRELAEEVERIMPGMKEVSRLNQAFLRRAILFMIDSGIHQFIDLGSGIPAVGHLHEVIQRANPECRIVYIDPDPVAVAHSALLFDRFNGIAVIQTDLRDIDGVLNAEASDSLLDLTHPVGLIAPGLHFVRHSWNLPAIIAGYRDRLVPGSYLALAHGNADAQVPGTAETIKAYQRTRHPLFLRSYAQIMAICAGFDLVSPGLVGYGHWRPEGPDDYSLDPAINSMLYAGVGRKPEPTFPH